MCNPFPLIPAYLIGILLICFVPFLHVSTHSVLTYDLEPLLSVQVLFLFTKVGR